MKEKILELTANIRRLADKGLITVPGMLEPDFNNYLNQIDIEATTPLPTASVWVDVKDARYKTLMYAGNYIDTSRLYHGIYSAITPHLYPQDKTIENLIEDGRELQKTIGKANIPDTYFENLKQCELVEVRITKESVLPTKGEIEKMAEKAFPMPPYNKNQGSYEDYLEYYPTEKKHQTAYIKGMNDLITILKG